MHKNIAKHCKVGLRRKRLNFLENCFSHIHNETNNRQNKTELTQEKRKVIS